MCQNSSLRCCFCARSLSQAKAYIEFAWQPPRPIMLGGFGNYALGERPDKDKCDVCLCRSAGVFCLPSCSWGRVCFDLASRFQGLLDLGALGASPTRVAHAREAPTCSIQARAAPRASWSLFREVFRMAVSGKAQTISFRVTSVGRASQVHL